MADQSPLKVILDGSSNTCGLGQFAAADTVGVVNGGTGLATQGICAFAQPGINAVACKTTYIGICAGKSEGAADENTYVGYGAGQNVTTGCYHTIIGSNAGDAITTCSSSVLIGYNAGTAITFGDFNTLIGTAAGAAVVTASNNTTVGYHAATATICSNNVAIGACAMVANTQGQDNVAIGLKAGATQVASGCNNVFVGSCVGAVALCRDNTLIGAYAGVAQTTATGNTMAGLCVGYGVVDGAGNVYLGYKAGLVNTSGACNVFIGNCAGVASTASCCLIIGNGTCDIITGNFNTGKVGIAIGDAQSTLHVGGDDDTGSVVISSALASVNSWNGIEFGYPTTRKAGIFFERTGNNYVGSLHFATENTQDTSEVALSDAKMTIDAAGKVGIGTTAPVTALHVVGDVLIHGSADCTDQIVLERVSEDVMQMHFKEGSGTTLYPSMALRYDGTGGGGTGNEMQIYDTDGDVARVTFERGGNVGIGTAAPSSILHAEIAARNTVYNAADWTTWGDLHVVNPQNTGSGVFPATGISFAVDANDYDNGAAGIAAVAGDADSEHALAFIIRPDGAASNEAMRIDSAGNVGIGTTAPASRLDVEITARNTVYDPNDWKTWSDIHVVNPQNTGSGVFPATGISFAVDANDYDNGAAGIAAVAGDGDSEHALAFIIRSDGAASNEAMRIDSAGNVGIGTTAPASLLHVQGVTCVTSDFKTSGDITLASGGTIDTGGNNNLTLDAGTADIIMATGSGASVLAGGPTTLDSDLTDAVGSPVVLAASTPTADQAFVSLAQGANTSGGAFYGIKTRGTGTDANTIVVDGDILTQISGLGADGAAYRTAGQMRIEVDGTPGSADMPGRISFWTTPDGSATVS